MTATRTTTLAARSSARPAATQRGKVFSYLLRAGARGATLEELEAALGMAGNTLRPRRLELEEKRLIADSGNRRLTRSGREAIVWIVPEPVRSLALAKLREREAA